MASAKFNTAPATSSSPCDTKNNPLAYELWNACAGNVDGVPKEAERVYYFLQGHIEQLQGTIDLQHDQQIPLFNLPSKILCHVMSVTRMIEKGTDEVYAQITLQAETKQIEVTNPVPEPPESPKPTVHSFSKILTASDTSTHGGFSVHRKHATDCLPPLDTRQSTPTQELVTKDLLGNEWRFKHIFRGQPRRHLLTTGWSTFVNSKKLVAGDELVFMRGDDNDNLMVGVRRLAWQQPPMQSSVLSAQSLNLAVLATAYHAIYGMSLFVIYYKPRSSPFIIGANKYLEALSHGYDVGMRVKMNADGPDLAERSFTGTIVEVGDFSPQWPGSHWRSLKVQWDEPSEIHPPDRVSPWEVEPYVAPAFQGVPPARNKRTRSIDVPPTFDAPRHSAISLGNAESSGCNLGGQQESFWQPSNVPLKLFPDSAESCAAAEKRSLLFSGRASPDPPGRSNGKQKVNENLTNCRIFGVDLTGNNASVAALPEKQFECPTVDYFTKQRNHSSFSRTRTKVQMQGVAVGRAVDLTAMDGYEDLITHLEKMFEIQGELSAGGKWTILFTDNEGDIMLLGDDPWQEFCEMVKRIFIYSSEEAKKMKPRCKIVISSIEEGEGTPDSTGYV